MSNYEIPHYKSTTLVQHISDTINKHSEIKYCFILGAGASKSSGISTGYELSKMWFDDIRRLFPDYQQWIDSNKIDESNLGKSYGKIYKKRFEINPVEGYEFLQKEMARSSPSFGYSILSQLLDTQHNVVITTNFDSLVEDALFLYSQNKPLICGHESLSEFVKPTSKRSIIIKVHRDLLLNPKNEDGELLKLEQGFIDSLDRIFQGYTPIVIGYGGNDISLMSYLNGCNSIKNIFWCKRTGDNLSDEITHLLESKKGKVFEIAGFDELMFQLYAEIFSDINLAKLIADKVLKQADDWADKKVDLGKSLADKESKESLTKLIINREFKDWGDALLAIYSEENADKREQIYIDSLKQFPTNPELNYYFAIFLQKEKMDYQNAEKYYLKALEIEPTDGLANDNYAQFLTSIKKDYVEAEKYYLKALEMEPLNVYINGDYAQFLTRIKKDYVEAEKYYLKALEIEPTNEIANGDYAQFLTHIKRDYKRAEKHYLIDLLNDLNDPNGKGNYAQLLIQFNKKGEAIDYIQKAFVLVNSKMEKPLLAELWLYCFANFYKEYPTAKKELEKLIAEGVKSEGWDFSININKAKEENHPEIDKVIEFAEKISGLKYS